MGNSEQGSAARKAVVGAPRAATRRSPLARYVVLLFMVGAILPLMAIGGLFMTYGARSVRAEAVEHLRREADLRANSILDRLRVVDAELQPHGSDVAGRPRYRAVAILEDGHGAGSFFGVRLGPQVLAKWQRQRLSAGRPLVVSDLRPQAASRVYLARTVTSGETIWAAIEPGPA